MENPLENSIKQKNVLSLAYLGDSVFTLFVRNYLVSTFDIKPNTLNKRANMVVCARAQAKFMEKIKDNLTAEELDIVNRTRNAHLNSRAKNSTLAEYSLATQFEALIGYWFMLKEYDKIDEIFKKYVVEDL